MIRTIVVYLGRSVNQEASYDDVVSHTLRELDTNPGVVRTAINRGHDKYWTIKPFPLEKKKTGTTIKLSAAKSDEDDGNENMIIENMNTTGAEEVNNGDVFMGSLAFETPLPSPRALIQVMPQVITPETTDHPSRIPQDTYNEEHSDDEEVMEGDENVDDDKSNDDGGDDDKSNDDGGDDEQVINDDGDDELDRKIFWHTQCITLLNRVNQKRDDERFLSYRVFLKSMYIEEYVHRL